MALTATLNKRNKTMAQLDATVNLAFSGVYPTNGETFSPQTVVGFTNRAPNLVKIFGGSGYQYNYNLSTGKILAYLAGVEVAAGAYPAAITGDTVRAECTWFP